MSGLEEPSFDEINRLNRVIKILEKSLKDQTQKNHDLQIEISRMTNRFENVAFKLSRFENLKFPTLFRKMWSPGEIEEWLDEQKAKIDQPWGPPKL